MRRGAPGRGATSASGSLGPVWALVPIRGLSTAKTRLGPDLDPAARRRLVEVMLHRTLVATREAASIARTIVVTMDPEAAGIAHAHHAIGLVERAPGLNEAIVAARSLAEARGARSVLVLPADIPAVSAEALDALVARAASEERAAPAAQPRDEAGAASAAQPADEAGAASAPEGATADRRPGAEPPAGRPTARGRGLVAAVPDQHGRGTNALLLAPPSVIAPAFGDDSLAVHHVAARAAGADWLQLDGPLALDVDTPADLAVAEATVGPLPSGR